MAIIQQQPSANNSFITLGDISLSLLNFNGVVLYCRVSTSDQKHRLPDQIEDLTRAVCWHADYMDGVVYQPTLIKDVFSEVHTGTTLDRPEFERCTEFAFKNNCIVCIPCGQKTRPTCKHRPQANLEMRVGLKVCRIVWSASPA
jgi:hypothetical protein